MYSGPGPQSLMAAAAAWDELAANLSATAESYSSVVANLTTGSWLGASSAALQAASAPYVAWLHATAAQAGQVGAQAQEAVAGYEAAFAATVPPAAVAANRAHLMALLATNFFGQNTAAIAMTELQYLEYWFQDGFAMDHYAANSLQAMAALPQHTSPPPVAQATPMMSMAAAPASVANAALAPTTSLASGLNLSSILSAFGLGSFTLPGSLPGVPAWLASMLTAPGATQAISMGGIPALSAMAPASMVTQLAGMTQTSTTGAASSSPALMNSIGGFVDGKMKLVVGTVANQLRSWGSSITAQLANASSIGHLSVPQAWSAATNTVTRAAPILPNTSVSAPALAPQAGMPGGPYGQALMGALSGRGLGGLAAKAPKVMPRPPSGG